MNLALGDLKESCTRRPGLQLTSVGVRGPTSLNEWMMRLHFLCNTKPRSVRCARAPGVEDMRLDFPVNLRIDRETVMAQFDYFSPELVSLAGALGLGLEISIYPVDLEELARAREGDSGRPSDT